MGDVVDVSLRSFDNGQELVNGSFTDKFILGEGHLMPGLEQEMEGMKVGEEKKFEITAPKDYWDENLRNKKISFEVKINSVFERKLPEINDEWAKSLGQFDNMEGLNNSIKDGLLYEKNLKERDRLRILISDKIVAKSKMELPEILINNETERRLHQAHHLSEDAGMSFEDYLKRIKKTEEELKEELKKEGEKDLRTFLVLREISKVEKCEPTEEELGKTVDEIMKTYPKENDGHNHVDRQSLFEYARERLTNEKVFQLLESL
jgi:trigger factor